MSEDKEKEFLKAVFLDWANFYRCSGSPTKSKDVNKVWQEWQGTITPNMKRKAEETQEFKTREFCDKKQKA